MVWVHGGAWFIGDRRRFPPTLTPGELAAGAIERGLAYVAVDYRLSLEAPFPAQIHDVKAALRYLRRFATILGSILIDWVRWGSRPAVTSSPCSRPQPEMP